MNKQLVCNCMTCDAEVTVTVGNDQKNEKNVCVGVHCNDCANKMARYEQPEFFGDFIYRLRKKYGWSRKFVARKLGFKSESSIMNFETGNTIMRFCHVARFCAITTDHLTVPILMSMFERDSLNPPCRCPCHQDFNNSIPSIYDDNDKCNLCGHYTEGGQFSNSGHWFEVGK